MTPDNPTPSPTLIEAGELTTTAICALDGLDEGNGNKDPVIEATLVGWGGDGGEGDSFAPDSPESDDPPLPDDPSHPSIAHPIARPTRKPRRSAAVSKRADPRYLDSIQNDIITNLGTLDELKSALCTSSVPQLQHLLFLMTNPKTNSKPMARLVRDAGVDVLQLMGALKDYNATRAMMTFVRQAPAIAHDITQDAKSTSIDCPKCGGIGQVEHPFEQNQDETPILIECVRCTGSGLVRKPGDSDARKLLAEAVGWTKNKSGPIMVVNFGAQTIESAIDVADRAININTIP